MVAYGPASMVPTSSIRIPASGAFIGVQRPAVRSPRGCGISRRSAHRASPRSATAAPTDRSPRRRRRIGTAPGSRPRRRPRSGRRRRGRHRGRAGADSSATSRPRPGCGWRAPWRHRSRSWRTGTPGGGGRSRRLAPGVLGGFVDLRGDVVTDRSLVGHPQHRAVGELTGDLQHHRAQRGNEHGQRRIHAGPVGVWTVRVAVFLDVDVARAGQRSVEHLEVVAGVGGGLLVRDAQHVAHYPVVQRPTPSASRPPPPLPACTDSAWRARATGCCACSGTTAVPSSIRLVRLPISDTMVSASKSLGTCGIQAVSKPADSAHSMSSSYILTLRAMSPRSAPIITPRRTSGLLPPPL